MSWLLSNGQIIETSASTTLLPVNIQVDTFKDDGFDLSLSGL